MTLARLLLLLVLLLGGILACSFVIYYGVLHLLR